MINLTKEHWKLMPLQKYFSIIKGNANKLNTRRESHSVEAIPLITSSATNNGVNIITTPKASDKIFHNVITINNNGSVGMVFYHPYNFIASSDVTILQPKNFQLNNNIALFFKAIIERQKSRFAFGFKMNNYRLTKLRINVPINNHTLDIQFINNYINNIRSRYSQEINLVNNENIHNSKYSLNECNWKEFTIKDISKVLSSTDYPKKDRSNGTTPYIGRTKFNNGITDYISKSSNTPKTFYKNVIAVNRNGSTGYAFYHPYMAYFSGGVRVLSFKKLDLAIGLFLTTCIQQQRHQFDYGFELGTYRLRDLKINLPENNNGNPNWNFMEKYIKSMIN